jgi:hypothetical protein
MGSLRYEGFHRFILSRRCSCKPVDPAKPQEIRHMAGTSGFLIPFHWYRQACFAEYTVAVLTIEPRKNRFLSGKGMRITKTFSLFLPGIVDPSGSICSKATAVPMLTRAVL